MCLFHLYKVLICLLIQNSLGNSIDDGESQVPLHDVHQELHINATSNQPPVNDDEVSEAITLQSILGVIVTMLRPDLSENTKTAYLLEKLKGLLKETAANNTEVTDKVDDVLRTLDKYKEVDDIHENSSQAGTNSPLRILVRKPTKPNEKLRFQYEVPNLSNSYCTEALLNIAKIAYQAYASLAKNPICNLPGISDFPTKMDTTIINSHLSELSDLNTLVNPSLTNELPHFQKVLPYLSNKNPKFDNLKDFENLVPIPKNIPNRPEELILNEERDQEVPYESNPLYPGNVNQAYDPFFPQSPDALPFDLYPHDVNSFLSPNLISKPYLKLGPQMPASNPLNNFTPDGKPMYIPESALTDFQNPDQNSIKPDDMAYAIPLLNNPNAPKDFPLNHFGYPETKNPSPKHVLQQTQPETPEQVSLLHQYPPNDENPAELDFKFPHPRVPLKAKNSSLFNFEINNPDNPSAGPDTGNDNPEVYGIQLNPNKLESDLAPFSKNPINEYEAEPNVINLDEAPAYRDISFPNGDMIYGFHPHEKPPYDVIPKTPSEIIPQDDSVVPIPITPSKFLESEDLKVIGFIRDAIDVIEGLIPAVKFDPPTLYVFEKIKNMLVYEDKDLEMYEYEVILELYKELINYIKHLKSYDQIIDYLDLSRVTNSPKLETQKVVELTYLVKRPKPVVYYPYYYVKYRLPYPSFVIAAQNIYKPKHLRMEPNQYKELLAHSKVVETSSDLKNYRKKDILALVFKSGSLVNAKLVEENMTLSDHLAALKDITSDLSADEVLKLNEDASNKVNLLAGNSENVNPYETTNERSDPTKPVNPLPEMLKKNQMQEIANSQTELNSKLIHPTTETSAELTKFDSDKLRSTLLRVKHVDLPFSDHSNIENQNNLYQPLSNNHPNREQMSPVMYKLLEETIRASLRGQNQQNILNTPGLVNIDNKKISMNTGEDNEQYSINISNPELNQINAPSFQNLENLGDGKATSDSFNHLNTISTSKNLVGNFKQTKHDVNNLWSDQQNYLNTIHNGTPIDNPENVEQTISHAGESNVDQHLYDSGAPTKEEISEDDKWRQQSYESNPDIYGLKSIPNQHAQTWSNKKLTTTYHSFGFYPGNPSQKNSLPASYPRNPYQSNPSQQNYLQPETYTVNSGQENNPQPGSYPESPDQATPSQQKYFPTGSYPVNSGEQNNHQSGSQQIWINPESGQQIIHSQQNSDQGTLSQQNIGIYTSNPGSIKQAMASQQNIYDTKENQQDIRSQQIYLSPGSYPANLGQLTIPGQQNPKSEMWSNPEFGQQVIPSEQSSGQGIISQDGIGIYSTNPKAFQQSIASQQNIYDTNNEMYGQQKYAIGVNAKRYVIPFASIIYKRPIIQRYSTFPVTRWRPLRTNDLAKLDN